MTSYSPAAVLLLDFPFPAGRTSKRRPVLVLADVDPPDIVVAQITSQAARGVFDVVIGDWKACGLLFPSCVRVDKVATLPKGDVRKALGSLTPDDRKRVGAALRRILDHWA